MNCITLKNPKASHVVIGRCNDLWMRWETKYKGPLLVHAGLGFDDRLTFYGDRTEEAEGAIIGFIKLLGMGKRRHGLVQWRIAFPMVFNVPILFRGNIKMYEVCDATVLEAINDAMQPTPAEKPLLGDVYPNTHNRLKGFVGD